MMKDICFAKSANLSFLPPFCSRTNPIVTLEIVILRERFFKVGTQRSSFTIWANSWQFGKFMGQSNSSLRIKITFTSWQTVFGWKLMKNLTTSNERKMTLISHGMRTIIAISRRWSLVSKPCYQKALSSFNMRLQSNLPASSIEPFLITIAIWRKLMLLK